MDNQHNNVLLSLILHIIVIAAIFFFHKTNLLIPSQAIGVEVSLIQEDEILPTQNPVVQKELPPIKTLNNNADINIKKEVVKPIKAKSITPLTVPKPLVEKVPQVKKLPITDKKKFSSKPMLKTVQSNKDKVTNNAKVGAIKGTALGSASNNNLISGYADQVIKMVLPYIKLPADISNKSLAVVQVTLLPNMQIASLKLVKSSGNDEYDKNVQEAIKIGAPIFPALPQNAKWTDYRQILLTFKPE